MDQLDEHLRATMAEAPYRGLPRSGHYRTERFCCTPWRVWLAMALGDEMSTVETRREDDGTGIILTYTTFRWRGVEHLSAMAIERFCS